MSNMSKLTPEQAFLAAIYAFVKAMDEPNFAERRLDLLADVFAILVVYVGEGGDTDIDVLDALVEGKLAGLASQFKGDAQ